MTHLCARVANLIFMDKNCLHVEANNDNIVLIYLTSVKFYIQSSSQLQLELVHNHLPWPVL